MKKYKDKKVICYTDYPLYLAKIPFEERVNKIIPPPGDEPTIYEVELVSFDGDKYAVVNHKKYGLVEFKAGYLNKKKDLSGDSFTFKELASFLSPRSQFAVCI